MLIHTNKDLNYCKEAEEKPAGRQREIACCSWTTVSGSVTPVFFKMKDEEGIIRTFDKLHVNYSEKKLYGGIPSYEFNCDVIVNGFKINLFLIYYPETCKWVLSEP